MRSAASRLWWGLWCLAVACSSPAAPTADNHAAPSEARPAPAPPAPAPPADRRYDTAALGAIAFELSEGTREARAHFTRGLLALHSFWYDEATRQFDAAIAADPTMNMAYWGAAMSRCKLLWGDDDVAGASRLLSRMPAPERLTPREQAWVMATVELLRAGDVRSSRKRFAAAMADIQARFPDDESATFLALALLAATRPDDPDIVEVRKRAAALAIGVFAHNPKHPGAAHYVIHAYDTPELAQLALPYARAYAQIAPEAFHARHMPGHIFARLGMWKEAIASCQSAWDASIAAARAEQLSANHDDFHSLNWLIEMNFELGHRADADRALQVFASAVRGGLAHAHRALYARQVASYLMRTGEWSRIDELLAPLKAPAAEDAGPSSGPARADAAQHACAPAPSSSPTELLEQISVFDARARAASAQHDVNRTKREILEMDAVRDKLRAFLMATQPKEVVTRMDDSQTRHRRVLLARAAGDDRALLDALRQSVVDEQETGGESNPSGFVVHEQIADTLLGLGRFKEAAAEYALVIERHPGRAHSLLGAARAAVRAQEPASARRWYQQLAELWSAADGGTAGLAEVRAAAR